MSTSDMYRYRQGVYGSGSAVDLTGFDVEATDGEIGKVDKANNETSASCLVVDTGFWIFGKKRMIPAGVVQRIDTTDKRVYVNLTKDQIKNAPDYDSENAPDYDSDRDDVEYRREVGDYYEPYRGY
jgi:PRC-barrel domain